MRKSFTWFLSLMVLLTAFASRVHAQEAQETIELYAEKASACYNGENTYTVVVSVRDFIKIAEFYLDLYYDDDVFVFQGASWVHDDLEDDLVVYPGGSPGEIWFDFDGDPTTIGDNLKTDIVTLEFGVKGFPGNVSTSFFSDLEWGDLDFYYRIPGGDDIVNTYRSFDGSLSVNVGVDINALEVEFSTETCAGGDVTMTVVAPDAAKYLFNEDPNPESWNWEPNPTVLANPGDKVSVRLMDENGCISLMTWVDVPETIDPVSFYAESHDPKCFGEKGLITIHATGGSLPYTYYVSEYPDGSGAVTKSNFSFTMAEGTYYVAVQDANGCANLEDETYWEPVTITDNNYNVEADWDWKDVSCFGANNGELTVWLSGEFPEEEELWVSIDGGVTWEEVLDEEGSYEYTFTNLAAGEYDVLAKNSAGCIYTLFEEDVVITEPDAITFDIEIFDTTCGGENDGQIHVFDIEGGTAPYTITIKEGNNETVEAGVDEEGFDFTGLKPTYYSLTIEDDNGCIVEYANPNGTGNVIAVQSPEDIKFTVNVEQPLCNDDDAIVTVTNITGGTGEYVILFNGEVEEENTYIWEASYPGLTVTVENAVEAGEGITCAVSQTVETPVNPAELIVAVQDSFPPTCIDGNDGSIRLLVSGGTEPYYFSINGGKYQEAKEIDYPFINIRVPVGTHTILVKDANDCEIEEAIEVTIEMENNVITAESDVLIECFGDKEGTISVNFTSWADGLDEGQPVRGIEYFVKNSNGTISTFMPSNAGGDADPTKFYAGTYTVWVVDQYTCKSNEVKVTVSQNYELLIQEVVANGASCAETMEGIITIYARGGTFTSEDRLEYAIVNNEGALGNIDDSKWLPFDDVAYPTNQPPVSTVSTHVDGGTYWIAVRDNGCAEVYYGPVEVDGYKKLLVDENKIITTDPKCYDSEDGTITVPLSAVSGGAGGYKFTLFVQNDGWEAVEEYTEVPTGDFTGLPAGIYYVLVEDEVGCPPYETGDFVLDNPEELIVDIEYFHFSCYGSNDGIVTLTAGGGAGNYSYAINNQNTWVAFGSGDNVKTYIATEPGTYTFWVKDANGCITEGQTITILQPDPIEAELEITDVSCNGGSDGILEVQETTGGWEEGVTTFEYKVDNGSWTSGTYFSGLKAGEHVLYVRGTTEEDVEEHLQASECDVAIPFTVGEPDPIVYDVEIGNISCKDGADGSFTVTILSGGTPWIDGDGVNHGYWVELTGDNYHESGETGYPYTITFNGLAHSHYTVYITDANGCTLKPTIFNSEGPYETIESWEVEEPDTYLTLDPHWIKDASCYGSEDGQFELEANGGTPPYMYYTALSVPPAGGGHYLVPDPSDEGWQESNVFDRGAGTWVTWVMDANGCIVGGEYDVDNNVVNKWRVKIAQPAEIKWEFANPSFAQPKCFGESNGAIYLANITGGTPGYKATVTGTSADGEPVNLSYSNIAATGAVLVNVPASDAEGFNVTITDSNGCTTAAKNVKVTQPKALEVSLLKSEGSFTCADAVEGWIETLVSGGTGEYEYQLLKNGVIHTAWQSIASAYLVQVGNEFTVQVRDANGCTAEATIVIDPVAEVVIAQIDDRTCYGDETPKAVVTATANIEDEGMRDMLVRFQPVLGEGLTGPWSDWVEFNELEGEGTHVFTTELTFGDETEFEGHFNFQVKDEMGCESEVEFMTFVPVQHPVHADVAVVEETECAAVVEITHVTGGVAPYVVLVNDEVVEAEEGIELPRGEHIITIVDAHQCVYEIPVDVEGEYVTRDTTIVVYIGHSVVFVDEESGIEETFTEEGEYPFTYDFEGCERTLIVNVVVEPRPLTIAEVQGEEDESPWLGDIVKIEGTVTGVAEGEGFFMQDANAPWSGIWVPYADAGDLEIGDGVAVVGEVDEISSVTSLVADEVEAIEPPLTVVALELDSPSAAEAEMYESVLVKVSGARATAADEGTGQWTIFYEDADDVVVNQWLYTFDPEAGTFYNVTGIVNTRLEAFKLEPRIEPDIEDLTATGVETELSKTEFTVYPNPFNDHIKINNIDKLTRVVVSNIAGQRVIDVAYPQENIRTTSLASGVYVVSMFTENGLAKTERIVKR